MGRDGGSAGRQRWAPWHCPLLPRSALQGCLQGAGPAMLARTRGDLAADTILTVILTLLAATALFPFPTSWQQQPCLLLTLTLWLTGCNSLKSPEREPGSEN